MGNKSIAPVYLSVDSNLKIHHSKIEVSEIFGINHNFSDLLFAFERDYLPYQNLVIGTLSRVDLVTIDQSRNICLRGIEIKLTALPDHTTCQQKDNKYSCEIVVRYPTIIYIALSIAQSYQDNPTVLINLLQPICNQIIDWNNPDILFTIMPDIINTIEAILSKCFSSQIPPIMLWKKEGKSAKLHYDCLDIFMWSNIAFTRLFIDAAKAEIKLKKISRHQRCVLWLIKMLYDFAYTRKIDYESIIDLMSFNSKNDKAFALSGVRTHKYMNCPELTQLRIKKDEIKNIILGNGERLLSPERRFDSIIFNTPGIFE